ncbi:glycosyltransferase family 2 protein [Frondihabitans peucedani]|uniref:Glycosyltransferase 2-like domain-containing protein n=1 Tax=Frondihabitans peucedani TaxID=598626 RepID=A0ABP8DZM3_9MICO
MTDDRGRRPGSALRAVAKRFRPAPAPLTVNDRLLRWARRIGEFGIVDREYFEILVGRSFATDAEAIEFYVLNDGSRGLSLSPLIEPEWLHDRQPDERMSWYDFLHQESADLVSTSPVFDAGVYAEAFAGANRPGTTLDALRHFLAHTSDATPLPVPPGRPGPTPTWGEVRRRALDQAKLFAAAQHRTRRRYRQAWGGGDLDSARAAYATGLARLAAERPLVSVILPTHDRAVPLETAIASVSAQTYDGWQLVVVDDGSTDGTAELLERLSAAEPRLTVVAQDPSGAAAARNAGLDAATGTFVAFLDSDNTWRPSHLEIALAALLTDDRSSVFTGLRMVGLNNTGDAAAESQETFRGESGTLDDLLAGNFIDLNALVASAAAIAEIGRFDTALKRWIDYEFVLRLARRSGVPHYVDHLTVDYDNTFDPQRLSSREGASWQEVAVAPHLIDWPALSAAADDRQADTVSIVMPVYREWRMTVRAVEAVLAAADGDADAAGAGVEGPGVEVVVVDNASQRSVSAILTSWFGDEPRVAVLRPDRNLNFGLGSDVGLAATTGAVVVMLNNDTEVRPGWLAPLLRELDDPACLGAQPLLLYPEGTVQAAGTVFGGDKVLPWHFLAGHPTADVERAGQTSFSAITAAAAAFRAADLIRWRGFDPVFANGLEDVDLCLRALDERPDAHFAVALDSVVVHHESRSPGRDDARIANRRIFDERWQGRYPAADAAERYATAGLSFAGVLAGEPKGHDVMVRSSQPVVLRPSRLVESGPWSGRPALRWAIKASPSAVATASSFAAALRDLGQDVVIDEPGAFYRSSCSLDDVCVAILDADRFVPQPGAVNVLWDPAAVQDPLAASAFAIHAGPGGVLRSPSRTTAAEALALEALEALHRIATR